MKKTSIILLLVTSLISSVLAQQKLGNETAEQKQKRMQWWSEARFGMFIHWGLYAIPAKHEWIKSKELIEEKDYQKYFDVFNPDMYNPKEWAKKAKEAGMKYVVLTTKHHEGFCLFDSKYTDYKAPNTQARRDLVKEFVEAVRAEGLRVGFYYSVIDWHHPDFKIDLRHPRRPADTKVMPKEVEKWQDPRLPELNKNRDMAKYRQYMKNQLTELLTNYGKIDELWLDFISNKGNTPEDYGSIELLKLVRKLQPNIIVNNRLGLKKYEDGQDFETPEQVDVEELKKHKGKMWETCQTFSGPWCYVRDDQKNWKSNKTILDLLISSVANGGNLLFNVGPTSRGVLDPRTSSSLDRIGQWMKFNSPAIYNCTYAPDEFKAPQGTRLTYNAKAKKLYVHLFDYPATATFALPGYGNKVKFARVLSDGSELVIGKEKSTGSDVVLTMPVKKPQDEIPVIELTLN